MVYNAPTEKAKNVEDLGGGSIWTVEGEKAEPMSLMDDEEAGLDEDDTKILLEKEFDDFFEDNVHKSAGPVVFFSKALGMLPVIWTEDESESECKSYFNLYTFILFLGMVFEPFIYVPVPFFTVKLQFQAGWASA